MGVCLFLILYRTHLFILKQLLGHLQLLIWPSDRIMVDYCYKSLVRSVIESEFL